LGAQVHSNTAAACNNWLSCVFVAVVVERYIWDHSSIMSACFWLFLGPPTHLLTYVSINSTGKSLSEALIFASTNPQYDDRLFIVHENCKLRIPAEHVVYTNCCFCFVLTFRTILVHNMFCRCCELLKKIYLY
jgi:hypothetical protein